MKCFSFKWNFLNPILTTRNRSALSISDVAARIPGGHLDGPQFTALLFYHGRAGRPSEAGSLCRTAGLVHSVANLKPDSHQNVRLPEGEARRLLFSSHGRFGSPSRLQHAADSQSGWYAAHWEIDSFLEDIGKMKRATAGSVTLMLH